MVLRIDAKAAKFTRADDSVLRLVWFDFCSLIMASKPSIMKRLDES
jgi:hypothetical protein